MCTLAFSFSSSVSQQNVHFNFKVTMVLLRLTGGRCLPDDDCLFKIVFGKGPTGGDCHVF